jgi:hypothetical protein
MERDITYLEAQLELKIRKVGRTKVAWAKAKKADDTLRAQRKKVNMDV